MKANRKFIDKTELRGGIATWVLMMFGLSVILYMFGLHSMWETYVNQDVNGTGITDSSIVENGAILGWFSDPIHLITVAGAATGLMALLAAAFGAASSTCAYIFIIGMLTVVLNLFIFPVSDIRASGEPLDATGIPFTVMLLAFFNIFYVLTVFEVISGRQT